LLLGFFNVSLLWLVFLKNFSSMNLSLPLFYEGMQMAQSRYLFALSCFQMDLLKEAEAALCPANEPGAEVL
jgi:anaphase-promoting complex subunit 3